MRKKWILGFLCLLSILMITGCVFGKKALTKEEFTKIAEDHGYVITDVKEQFIDYEQIEEAIVASNKEGWQIEFYVLTDLSKATKMFNKNVNDFENEPSGIQSSIDSKSYKKYTKENEDYYMSITMIDSTVLYLKVPAGQKDDAQEIVSALKY